MADGSVLPRTATEGPGPGATPEGPSALEKKGGNATGAGSSALEAKSKGSLALEKKAADIVASITARTRAPAPPAQTFDFTTLEKSRFGLKGVFIAMFVVNAALIGGFIAIDKRYKFSPQWHEHEWEHYSVTRQKATRLRELKDREAAAKKQAELEAAAASTENLEG